MSELLDRYFSVLLFCYNCSYLSNFLLPVSVYHYLRIYVEQKRNVARWLCKNGNRPEILLQLLLSKVIFKSKSTLIRTNVQLNKYETVPYFLQLSQNLTMDCLLISVYLPVFTSFCMMCL